ncbi:swi/snf complex subunit swi3c [Phtheirospermum japonicum]|uniref:Swi/snf complex subunit swi3c n=1 Tax=Phtheirospermum japonicum TaxID=374723 RepID=A0A830BDT0_9LAMI|nr:swi/snf complex subunit swi3c [Phtheirospermum japonicum]
MPASSSEAGAKWRKRKRDHTAARKSKLKQHENDDTFEDNDDDDDPDLDPPHNHLETEDDPPNPRLDRTTQLPGQKEGEKIIGGGLRICEFPVAIQRQVSRPHSSVFRIVEAERAAGYVDSRGQGQGGVAMLENISHGQLQALSVVPRDSPALLGEETASGSYVIEPPRITAGGGVTKRLGSAGRIHVVPVHSVHRLERQVVPHFFAGKPGENTPEKYMECRNFIVAKYMENPEKHLSAVDCQGLVAGVDNDDLNRIVRFLDNWGLINYCAMPLKHEVQKEGTYLYEDSNGELHMSLAALKSIDSLIKFDKPVCRLKATDVYPELAACQRDEESDLDSTIRMQLFDYRCNCCSGTIPTVYYQSQKEVDVRLCLDCFHEGGFVAGHSSLDFVKENSIKEDYVDVDGDSWSDQETLLLLEGMQLYSENWNKIAEHVGSKSKAQCIVHFVSLPLDGVPLENIGVPITSGSSNDNHERDSNGFCLQRDDTESKFPFSNSENPVMSLVAFLASSLGPRVAAACAHASLASLSKDSDMQGSLNGGIKSSIKIGPLRQHGAEGDLLPVEKVRVAAKDGLDAAAMKAKLFADHEEREIQRLSANIVNHQLRRLELKLKQFTEIETLLTRECEQMERARQRIAAERAHVMSPHFGSPGVSRATSLPGPSNAIVNNNSPGNNSRQQHVLGSQPPFVSGYGSNHQIHSQMSMMQQQQQQQQQGMMYGLGPRLPLSAIHPPSSMSNAMFGSPSNSQQSLGHSMLRPVSGTKSGLG